MDLIKNINETTEFLNKKLETIPDIALILGSGLGSLADEIKDCVKIKYKDIPNFPTSTVEGHAGQLVFGKINDKDVMAMQGRFHYYEGYTLEEVTFPIRIMKSLGIKKLVVTNAAGSANRDFSPGDLMIIRDHINLSFRNPLIGKNYDELGTRFPDMSQAYDKDLIKIAMESGKKLKIDLKEGVYTWVTGPSYETPSEVKMMRLLGIDAIGMSTVPEVIVARHSNMKVLGISCITNMASGILDQPLDHNEVIETSNKVKNDFIRLVKEIIRNI
ncbi:purine nucleoside phosphorylase 1 [Gottschalkia purinilytica]|uniref:Purine nucleoside phosphorylase n=1 Tax=Gottschalkia purinilytica TaxID=1503 RepID=A0A0L0W803_GOTPU|nr:purine-nucleoside phosphorylase [Gottschalkia purinilytica]KNF07425.1 purine nucleoside phosphorylase 1 [Gottschalkia purinilytica]